MIHVAVTHHRVKTGGIAESATVAVSEKAATNHRAAVEAGLAVHIRQALPGISEHPSGEGTVGVTNAPTDDGKQRIAVTLEHRRGAYKAVQCFNEPGDNSPQATLEKLLLAFDKADLVKWLQAN